MKWASMTCPKCAVFSPSMPKQRRFFLAPWDRQRLTHHVPAGHAKTAFKGSFSKTLYQLKSQCFPIFIPPPNAPLGGTMYLNEAEEDYALTAHSHSANTSLKSPNDTVPAVY